MVSRVSTLTATALSAVVWTLVVDILSAYLNLHESHTSPYKIICVCTSVHVCVLVNITVEVITSVFEALVCNSM